MVELLESWLPIINALILAPLAWQSPAALAAGLGRDVEETTDLLCLLDEAGWIDVWEDESGPLVTFSVLAAGRLQIHLVEVGLKETPRWARIGDPIPPCPKARHVCGSDRGARLDFLIDPAPTPDIAAEEAERAAARVAKENAEDGKGSLRAEDWPRPTLLIGQGLSPWPGPGTGPGTGTGAGTVPKAPCPACLNRSFRAHMYCIRCDRWGCDLPSGLTARPARRKPNPPSREGKASHDRREAERARALRKAKRRAQHQAKAERDPRRRPMPSVQECFPGGAPSEVVSSGIGKPASSKARR